MPLLSHTQKNSFSHDAAHLGNFQKISHTSSVYPDLTASDQSLYCVSWHFVCISLEALIDLSEIFIMTTANSCTTRSGKNNEDLDQSVPKLDSLLATLFLDKPLRVSLSVFSANSFASN